MLPHQPLRVDGANLEGQLIGDQGLWAGQHRAPGALVRVQLLPAPVGKLLPPRHWLFWHQQAIHPLCLIVVTTSLLHG
jgi:hypothetical protein